MLSLAAASEAPPKHVFVRSAGLRPHLVSALSFEIDEAVRFLQRCKRQFRISLASTDMAEGRQPPPTTASAAGEVAYVRRSRSEERRVGKECGSTCRFRWWPYH